MRNIVVLILLLFLFMNGIAQRRANLTWFDISVKGAYGSTFLINRNIIDDSNVEMDILSKNYSYGARLGFFVTEHTGISIEGQNMLFTQKYNLSNGGYSQDINYSKEITFESQELALLFRAVWYTGVYIEIGPKFGWIESVATINSIENIFDDAKTDQYRERYTSVLLGLGLAVLRSPDDRLRLNLGVRLHYTIDDIVVEADKPIVEDGVYNLNYQFGPNYSSIQTTKPLLVQVVAELNYFFAFYGRARCGRTKFVFFKGG